jgi:hypothetical protein
MPFPIDEDEMTAILASSLKTTPDKITATGVWEKTIVDSIDAAYQDIVGALTERGYTSSQIAAWDRAEEYNRDLGLFWCLVKGAGLHGNDPTFINKLDRRKELESVAILIDGVMVTAAGVGEVGYGVLDTIGDQFTKDMEW